jgi:hypothetical protein
VDVKPSAFEIQVFNSQIERFTNSQPQAIEKVNHKPSGIAMNIHLLELTVGAFQCGGGNIAGLRGVGAESVYLAEVLSCSVAYGRPGIGMRLFLTH